MCNAEIEEVNVGMAGSYSLMNERIGVDLADRKRGFAYFEGTPVTPGKPLFISVWSNQPFSVLEVSKASFKDH